MGLRSLLKKQVTNASFPELRSLQLCPFLWASWAAVLSIGLCPTPVTDLAHVKPRWVVSSRAPWLPLGGHTGIWAETLDEPPPGQRLALQSTTCSDILFLNTCSVLFLFCSVLKRAALQNHPVACNLQKQTRLGDVAGFLEPLSLRFYGWAQGYQICCLSKHAGN